MLNGQDCTTPRLYQCPSTLQIFNCTVSIACFNSHRWDMGDGTVKTTLNGIRHNYRSNGTYTIRRDGQVYSRFTISGCSSNTPIPETDCSSDQVIINKQTCPGYDNDGWPRNKFSILNPTSEIVYITSLYGNGTNHFNADRVTTEVVQLGLSPARSSKRVFDNPNKHISFPTVNQIGLPLPSGNYVLYLDLENCHGQKTVEMDFQITRQ